MKLEGKVALVTGAGQGMGRAIAERFHAEGAQVVVNDLSPEEVEATVTALGDRCLALPANIADSAAVAEMFDQLHQHHPGGLDLLVNNAGIGAAPGDGFDLYQQRLAQRGEQLARGEEPSVYADQITDMEDRGWQAVMNVNINGVFHTCREAVRSMVRHGRSGCSIVNISSTSALSGEGAVHYCASKAAVLGLTRCLATELGARGIRVNAICPGPTNTRMMDGISKEWMQAMVQAVPLGRIGEPHEVAAAALFLASDEASFFTGQTLMANGGTHLL